MDNEDNFVNLKGIYMIWLATKTHGSVVKLYMKSNIGDVQICQETK